MFLEISQNSQENTCARVSFLNKGLRPATLFKKETLAQVFSCEFCKISKNIFSYRTPLVAASGLNFFLQQFFKFSRNIFTSFSLLYISKLYKFLDLKLLFYLLVDNQVTEFFKEFRNGYFCIELSITLSSNHCLLLFVKQLLFPKVHGMNFFIDFLFISQS